MAIDESEEAIDELLGQPLLPKERIETRVVSFENLAASGDLPEADFVNAAMSLQQCSRAKFPTFWELVCRKLRVGGFFAGNLMGTHDPWAEHSNVFTGEEAAHLFAGFEVLAWNEREFEAPTMDDKEKHWHLFDIVARKR